MSSTRPPIFMRRDAARGLDDDPLWYKDAVIYEVRTRSFHDSDGDGIGDLRGLTSKLDYLMDLGVTALWLLPICPSPGRDDGYDISDYTDIHPDVGTLDDFKLLLEEAHRRGLRIITELVLNHTSDQHPWFERARRAPPGSPERDFYVWSDTQQRYRDARIIFKDFEVSNWTWDPVARAFFWHRFYAHQPDLNYENPAVQEAAFAVLDFWFGLGVDGLRLDAVPYLFERDGTMGENLPETHAFLKRLRAQVDARWKNRMLLAEANQWPEDAAAYFGAGDECHMNFHFPIMPRLFMSIHMEDRFPIIDILQQTPALHPTCQWAMFLRNHDELTLEMVTDEERDYMVRAYAYDKSMRINLGIRRRLAPLAGNDRRRIELMNGLLFSLPGTPVLYYGDEIGMGDNIYLGDRNGVRTPMQWSADRNAGFSRANPQRLILPIVIDPEYHYEAINVEMQQDNASSLLWWTKRLIDLRKRHPAFGRGGLEMLSPDNPRVLAFVRRHGDDHILVVANLSRQVQFAELDLAPWKGMVPTELFGHTAFPPIGDAPYLVTLGGHAFYWFELLPSGAGAGRAREAAYVAVTVAPEEDGWRGVSADDVRPALEDALPAFLVARRWFVVGGAIERARIVDAFAVGDPAAGVEIAVVKLEYVEGGDETYALPLALASGDKEAELRARQPQAILAAVQRRDAPPAVLFDAFADPAAARALLEAMLAPRRLRGASGWLTVEPIAEGPQPGAPPAALEPRVLRGERPSVVAAYGAQHLLRFHRWLEEGPSADLEIGRALTALSPRRASTPAWTAAMSYRAGRGEPSTVATLQAFVPAESDAWTLARNELRRFYELVLAGGQEARTAPPPAGDELALLDLQPPPAMRERLGTFFETVRLLGRRVGELHLTLASAIPDPAFAPEAVSALDQRSIYQTMRNVTGRALRTLRTRLASLPPGVQKLAREVIAREADIHRVYQWLRDGKLTALRARVHGNLHLQQVLFTGKDFVIIDFEGQRGKPLSDRRRKRSPLRDVATLLRSLHWAAFTAILEGDGVREADRPLAEAWGLSWYRWMATALLGGYLELAAAAPFMPTGRDELSRLIQAYVLERSFVEVESELERDPARVGIPILALAEQLSGYQVVGSD
jgi:maltose alpha-D-glucosyltransferase/alpha-amylase